MLAFKLLNFSLVIRLLENLEDEVHVGLGGVDAHEADSPDLAGGWPKTSCDLKLVPTK